jgi:hypothetical protein
MPGEMAPFASITWIRFNGSFAQQNSQPAAFGRLAPRTFVTIPAGKAGVKPPPDSPALRVHNAILLSQTPPPAIN